MVELRGLGQGGCKSHVRIAGNLHVRKARTAGVGITGAINPSLAIRDCSMSNRVRSVGLGLFLLRMGFAAAGDHCV